MSLQALLGVVRHLVVERIGVDVNYEVVRHLFGLLGSGWVELFSTATLTGAIAVVGIILRMFCKNRTTQQVGNILMGFAVLMTGITAMSGSVAHLRESATFISVLTSFSNPFLGILVGLLFTCVLQSASAAVGILQALAVTGAVSFQVALPIIMGIAIGAGAAFGNWGQRKRQAHRICVFVNRCFRRCNYCNRVLRG